MTPEDTNKKTEHTPEPDMELEWLDDFAPETPKAAEEPKQEAPKTAEPPKAEEKPKPAAEPKPEPPKAAEEPKPVEKPAKAAEPKPEKEAPKAEKEEPKPEPPKEEAAQADAGMSEADVLAEARRKREKKKAAAERRRREEALRKKKRVSTALMVLCIIVAIGSAALVIRAVYYYQNARSTYGNAQENAVSAVTDAQPPAPIEADPAVESSAEAPEEEGRPEGAVLDIDFASLKEINPDVVAWLHVPALDLSYPVMQGEDNEYYLTHTLENEYNPLGSVFMECTNLPDFSHGNTLIYGHNTADGTMFGRLREFGQDPSLRANNPFFYVYQADGKIGKYRIYSYYSVYKDGDSFAWFTDPESYDYYVNLTKNLSIEPIEADFTDRHNLVTLSTCFGASGTPYRFLVHGVRE